LSLSLARVRLLTYEAFINAISNRDFIKIICLLKQVIRVAPLERERRMTGEKSKMISHQFSTPPSEKFQQQNFYFILDI
jgi:hypothetical protein